MTAPRPAWFSVGLLLGSVLTLAATIGVTPHEEKPASPRPAVATPSPPAVSPSVSVGPLDPAPPPPPEPFAPPPAAPPAPPPPANTGGGHVTYTMAYHPGWPYPPWSVNWDDIAYCESTWRWHVNTGNGYYGGLQFTLSTWLWYGGDRFAYWPHRATPYEQKIVAERVLTGWDGHRPKQGIGAWPVCGRFGR